MINYSVLHCYSHWFQWSNSLLKIYEASVKYHKNPKNAVTWKICCNHPKIWTRWLYPRVMRSKMQTEWQRVSTLISLIWVYTVCTDLSVWKLRIITVLSKLLHWKNLYTTSCIFKVNLPRFHVRDCMTKCCDWYSVLNFDMFDCKKVSKKLNL